ncbi:tetratricopeptide repeat protein, partial [Planctomycetota bacterium]
LENAKDQAPPLAVGCALHLLERYHQAIDKLHTAPDTQEKYWLLGYSMRGLRRHEDAVGCFQKASELGADATTVALEKIAVWRAAGNLEAAEAELHNCSGGENVNPDFHYQRARLLEAQGLYDEACEQYRTAIELNPDHQQALFRLALRSDFSGDEEAAIDYYKQMVGGGGVLMSVRC